MECGARITHQRSKIGELRHAERRQIWLESYRDKRKKETICRTDPYWHSVVRGEVLVDSRGEGAWQYVVRR
jgi:hypothetical protein